MQKINPIKSSVLFSFVQELSASRGFENKTDWGFSVLSKKDDIKEGRWGKVLEIGPEVTEVEPGDFIYIEPLRWSSEIKVNDISMWMTNENEISLVSKELPKLL